MRAITILGLLAVGAALVAAQGPKQAWHVNVKGPIKSTMSLVGFGKDRARIIVSANDTIYALDRDTGATQWSYAGMSELTPTTVSEFDGLAFAGDANGNIHAVDIMTGKLKWKKSIASGMFSTKPALAVSFDRKSIVVFADDNGALLAFGQDGSSLWNKTLDGRPGTPVIAEKHLFVTYKPWNFFLCLTHEDGKMVWNYSSTSIQSVPATLGDLTAYIGNEAGLFTAIFIPTGKQQWNQTTATLSAMPLADGDAVFFGDVGGYVWAFDSIFGKTMWGTQTNSTANGISAYPAADRDFLFIGGTDGVLYTLTRSNGTIAHTFQSGGPIEKLAVAADFFGRRYYFGNSNGDAYAFDY